MKFWKVMAAVWTVAAISIFGAEFLAANVEEWLGDRYGEYRNWVSLIHFLLGTINGVIGALMWTDYYDENNLQKQNTKGKL